MTKRPPPNPGRYLRQLFTIDLEEAGAVGFPRRTLAGLLAFTFLLAPYGITPAIFPAWLWDAAYTITGLALAALATGLHNRLAARAAAAFLAGITLGARTVALAVPLFISTIAPTPTLILGLAVWPTLGAFAIVLLAYWHRLG